MMTPIIDQVLKSAKKSYTDLAKHQAVSPQNISRKSISEKWYGSDLLDIGKITNTRLAYIDENNAIVFVFEEDDE